MIGYAAAATGRLTAYQRLLDALGAHGSTVKSNGVKAMAQCPAHPDNDPSLSVTQTETRARVHCFTGCDDHDILAALKLTVADLYNDPRGASYSYTDVAGTVLRTVHRTPGKKFSQTVVDKSSVSLYRLPKVVAAVEAGTAVYVVEGEEDVHSLESIGAVATCSPQGASNWHHVDPAPLTGATVVVVPDRDEPGKKYAAAVSATLATIAASVSFAAPKVGKDASDHVAACHGLDDLVPLLLDDSRPWQPVDLDPVLDGTWQPPQPTVGRRSDGKGLFYPGKVHTIASETEAGKTWFALSACVDEINDGNHVAYLDFEDSEGGVVSRLLTIGVHRDRIRDQFHYLNPGDPLGTGINRDDLHQILTERAPTLAVVDGITEAMVLHGLNPLDNKDAATFGRILPRFVARYGPAVACLDHVTKDREGRGRYALGAVHKLNGLDGAAYVLDNRTPFGIGLTGRSTIKISKDRPGQLRRHGLPSSSGMAWYGDLVLDSHGEDFTEVTVEPPADHGDDFRPTVLMERIAVVLVEHGPLAQRRIEAAVKGKTASIRDALNHLILDGYVTDKTPHELLKPYPPAGDPE